MRTLLQYARGTELVERPTGTDLFLGVDAGRVPVAARATLADPLPLREALLALGRFVTPEQRVNTKDLTTREQSWTNTLDPLVTVQRDQISFEVFSADGGAYGLLALPATALTDYHLLQGGTTTAELTWAVGEALQAWRSSHHSRLVIGAMGLADAISPTEPVQRTVELSDAWLRAVTQTQLALLRRPFVFDVHPGDFMSLISYIDEHSAARPPRSLRYEFQPGSPLQVVLEPWEERITFHQTRYGGYRRTVRLWGRRRLLSLAPLMPYVDRVTIAIYGRGLPHVYICHLGGFHLVLAINGWTGNDAQGSGLDLPLDIQAQDVQRVDVAAAWLRQHESATRDQLLAGLGWDLADLEPVLYLLVQSGRALFDVTANRLRHRDLFTEPLDTARLFAPDPRAAEARRLVEQGGVTSAHLRPSTQSGRGQETRVDATVVDGDSTYSVEFALDEGGRMTFGRCGCSFFQSHIMTHGPCAHLLAARLAFEATADEAPAAPAAPVPLPDDAATRQALDEVPF